MIKLDNVYLYDRGPDIEAVASLYRLLEERPAEANISHRQMPTIGEHMRFVASRPYKVWNMITRLPDGAADPSWRAEHVGSIYLTKADEVGISIFRKHQRRGFAREALRLLRLSHPGRILANVAPENHASHAFFRALGGKVIQHTYEL